MSESKRLKEVQDFVWICFGLLEYESYPQIAKMSGLSVSTVYRLASGNASLNSRIGTIQALGYAAGIQLELGRDGARIKQVA